LLATSRSSEASRKKDMANQIKTDKVNILREKIAKAKSMVFAEYHGLDANKVNELRAAITETGAEMTVAKNTLLKVALGEEKAGSKELTEHLQGPVATIFAYEDPIAPIKAIAEFAEEHEFPTLKAGMIDGEYTDAAKLNILSKLPSRDELIAKVVGSLKAPLSGIATVLGGTQRNFVYALSAIAARGAVEASELREVADKKGEE
jgi:large subunit ribosomal protein L10